MIAALVEKELRQHGSMIVFFWMFIAIGLFLLKSNDVLSSVGGSGFYLVGWLLFVLFPLACLVLGNALIATEFRQQTQIFLEGLPLPRRKMVAVKYCCGLVVAVLTALMPLVLTIASGWDAEALSGSFLILIVIKTSMWAWFAWSAIFPFSLLGRYRMMVGLTVVLGLIFAQNLGGVPVTRFGPFELIGDQFAYERFEYPVDALWITAGLIVLFTCAGFAMALARDATLASMLAEKMSTRERTAMIALGIAGMMIAASLIERVEKTDPLDLPDSIDVVDASATVSIAAAVAQPTDAERDAMQQHAESAARQLNEVAEFLGIKKLPPLFLVHRRDLDAVELEDGEIDSRQGCLVRLNVLKTPPTDLTYQSHVIEKLLDANQHYRLNSDTRGWILQGFACWWPRRTFTEDQLNAAKNASKAASSSTVGKSDEKSITVDALVHWKKFREILPPGFAGSLASRNVEALWSKDERGCRDFLAATLGYCAPHDVRATIHDRWYNVPSLVRQHLKTDLQGLAVQWNKAASSAPSSTESPSP